MPAPAPARRRGRPRPARARRRTRTWSRSRSATRGPADRAASRGSAWPSRCRPGRRGTASTRAAGLPQVEAKARQYIHLGYQRLVSFEVPGGGFDWFGRPPANRTLTAYGLMEFADMARVHDVDPKLIDRTRQWLLSQQEPDGTWAPE